MADWDDDEWEAPDLNAPQTKALPTSWSDEEDEEDESNKAPVVQPSQNTPKPPAPKTGLALKIAEREKREAEEARKKAEIRSKLMASDEEAFAGLEGDDLKRAKQQKELEADALDSAMDAFGVTSTAPADSADSLSALDALRPVSTKDFETLATLLNEKLSPHEGKPGHLVALKGLIRAAVANLSTDDAKDLSSFISVLYNDKVKLDRDKDKKGKKKGGPKAKASLSASKGGFDDFDTGGRGDVDDFF